MVGEHELHARVAAPHRGPAASAPVVLVHGLGVSSAYMVPLLESIARWARCWAPDLPGHGRSSDPGTPLSLHELVDVLEAWLVATRLERPLLVANSYGCQVAAELARRSAIDPIGLVLLGPATDMARRSSVQQAIRLAADQLFEPAHLTCMQALDYLRTGPLRTLREFRDSQRHDLTAALAGLDLPVVLGRGARDPIAPLVWLERLATSVPGARVEQVAGRGHCINYTAPEAVSAMARSLLD